MRRLEGRIAVVTGAARGIGHATARRLADEGATVVVTDVQHVEGEQTVAAIRGNGGSAYFRRLDVVSLGDWERLVNEVLSEHRCIDILVSNAGVGGGMTTIEETTPESYDRTIAVNLTGVFLGMRACADALKASGHGSVVNMSSVYAASGGRGTSPAYHAAKGAVRSLTKNVALQWATHGVRVNSVHPGFIRTPMLELAVDSKLKQELINSTPMARLGEPEEVAAAVAYLASDDASFVTGSELYVDGGFIAR